MNDIKIIYYLKAEDNSIFIELKRLNYKQCKDKSKYVSWFRISNDGEISRLKFIKMFDCQRYFQEGEMVISDSEKIYRENNVDIKLFSKDIDESIVNLCLEYWETK